jgi:gluconate kinase
MSSESKILFLFGLAGSGKSYLANLIAQRFGYFNYEGDDDLTPSMKEAIRLGNSFNDQMRLEFFQVVAARILELSKVHRKIVVSQGLYKNLHRKYLLASIPNLQFVWVRASDDVILKRIRSRGDAGIGEDYVKAIRANFEEPDLSVIQIDNSGDGVGDSLEFCS